MNENNKLIAEFMGLYEKHPLGSFLSMEAGMQNTSLNIILHGIG